MSPRSARPKLLAADTLRDGRIVEVLRSGFIEGTVYVSGLVLAELQADADAQDPGRSHRGRFALQVAEELQGEPGVLFRTFDSRLPRRPDPAVSPLVLLARALDGTIVTSDATLRHAAGSLGVPLLDIRALAEAIRPPHLPGQKLLVTVVKEGREPRQGIGYLNDGTMVVVENAHRRVGELLEVVITSVLQTLAGRLIFASIPGDEPDDPEAVAARLLPISPVRTWAVGEVIPRAANE